MDQRKRSAPDDHSDNVPMKRQAVAVNGTSATSNKSDEEMPWKEELELWQKDAALRQMREYKREKTTLEAQLQRAQELAEYHDEHLRIIDAWLLQLVDEISVLSTKSAPQSGTKDQLKFSTSLLSADIEKFQEHISGRSEEIKSVIEDILSHAPSPGPATKDLQEQVSHLLAEGKVHKAELKRVEAQTSQLDERLFNATNRYMNAEKQLDRAKSAQVAKLEASAIRSSRTEPNEKGRNENTSVESDASTHAALSAAAETAQKEAKAVAEKQQEHLEKLSEDNKKLQSELTAAQTRFNTLTDDDYANTELFQNLKSQHNEVIKRINDLEAKHVLLREEAKSLHAERTAFREEAENELRSTTIEMQGQIAQKEGDLARIRSARDELIADISMRKAASEQHKNALEQLKELSEAKQSRVSVLESEVERLRFRVGEVEQPAKDVNVEDQDVASLQSKLQTTELEKTSLEQELRSMESAWRKASTLASKKIPEIMEVEDRIAKISAEKAKADQKYFATMKLKETRDYEIRTLKAQNSKSSEIVSQLKETESTCRNLQINTEKQLADAKDSLLALENQYRTAQQNILETKAASDRLTSQTTELKKALESRDEQLHAAQKTQRQAEVESKEMQTKNESLKKEVEKWKKKALGNEGDDVADLKKLLYCGVCNINVKNTLIQTCRHILCETCVSTQYSARSRRCPLCNKSFGQNDTMRVVL